MKLPKSAVPILIIAAVVLLVFRVWLNPYEMPYRGDPDIPDIDEAGDLVAYNAVNAHITRESLLEKRDFTPLWDPFRLGGEPFFLKPQVTVYSFQTIFLIFSPNAWLGIKLSIIFHMILAGISMYFLANFLVNSRYISLASAMIYILNPHIIGQAKIGHINIVYPYSVVPLIVLFTLMAFESRKWLIFSLFIGALFAFQVHSSGDSVLLFSGVLFAFVLLFHVFSGSLKERAIRASLIGLVVLVVLLGLAAVKVLPSTEFIKISSRQEPFSFETSTGGGINLLDLFISSPVGMLPLILALFSLAYIRKKRCLLFLAILVLSMLILTASPLYYIMWKYVPFFDIQKGLFKGIFLFAFSITALSAYGMLYLSERLKGLKIFGDKYSYILMFFIVLVAGNFMLFGKHLGETASIKDQIENNHVMQFMSKQPGQFRFHNFETNGIDWGVGHVSVPLHLEDVYGYDNIWHPEYMPVYLSVANSERAKLFGILNMKYLTSTQPLDISGFELVAKFDGCGSDRNNVPLCQPLKSQGPYLYENKLVMPRAYIVNSSILLIGDEEQVLQAAYTLLLNDNFDPSSTVIVMGSGKLADYNIQELRHFSAIMLLQGSINDASKFVLKEYSGQGGMLFPNVLEGRYSVSVEEIELFLKESGKSSGIRELKLQYDTFDKIKASTSGEKGFLVLSEKFSLYPGWEAKDENGDEKRINRANGIVSAVYLEGNEDELYFSYSPPKFRLGMVISLATLIAVVSLLAYLLIKGRGDPNKDRD